MVVYIVRFEVVLYVRILIETDKRVHERELSVFFCLDPTLTPELLRDDDLLSFRPSPCFDYR